MKLLCNYVMDIFSPFPSHWRCLGMPELTVLLFYYFFFVSFEEMIEWNSCRIKLCTIISPVYFEFQPQSLANCYCYSNKSWGFQMSFHLMQNMLHKIDMVMKHFIWKLSARIKTLWLGMYLPSSLFSIQLCSLVGLRISGFLVSSILMQEATIAFSPSANQKLCYENLQTRFKKSDRLSHPQKNASTNIFPYSTWFISGLLMKTCCMEIHVH